MSEIRDNRSNLLPLQYIKLKLVQINPWTGHEGTVGEKRYSSTLSLTSELERVGCQRHAPADLPLGKTHHPLYRTERGPQIRYGQVQNISPPQEFDPRTAQPAASRYTVWDKPATSFYIYLHSVPKVQQIYVKSEHWWCASHLTLFRASPPSSYSSSFYYPAHTNVYLNVCDFK